MTPRTYLHNLWVNAFDHSAPTPSAVLTQRVKAAYTAFRQACAMRNVFDNVCLAFGVVCGIAAIGAVLNGLLIFFCP